jgi:hypothetical protein
VRISDWLAVTSKKEIAGADSRRKATPSRMEELKIKRKMFHYFAGRGVFLLDQLFNG